MSGKLTLEDLIRIFGQGIFPKDVDTKLIMKNFDIGINRVIGKRSIEKIKEVLLNSIDTARREQYKNRGGVIDSPVSRLSSSITVKNVDIDDTSNKEDKYDLSSIKSGIVSRRLQNNRPIEKQSDAKSGDLNKDHDKTINQEKKLDIILPKDNNSLLPSVEDLTILSGGNLARNDIENGISSGHVQREVSIRSYKVSDESRSARWGKEAVKNRKGITQEINHPAYIFHSDLWQIEAARERITTNRCDILQHVTLDMVANNINVVMLDSETEPFFVVEGFGLLYSKDSLRDKVKINELIQLMIISCEAWQIALKRPEAMIKGQDVYGKDSFHTIDMTSVIPLAEIRGKIVDIDNEFKANYDTPDFLVKKVLHVLQNHRKNVIWTCGATVIPNLRETIKEHKNLIENPNNILNVVVVGTNTAYHPVKVKFSASGEISFEELFPSYCKKHSILNDSSLKNIFGSIPAIFDSHITETSGSDLYKIANAVYQRLGYSALENQFDPGFIRNNPNDIMPLSNLDIILPPLDSEMEDKLERKGFKII
ncbi:MAG: hypothetical protein JXA54_06105 [Candidatus Heimdallarchaeota archaeon]|nr:hypothetical protein [Candidatus Heimdallarchaeota archaeon]